MRKSYKNRIGIFDSGFGGLTVLKGLKETLPQYDYCYFGDNFHAPYGERDEEEIYRLTKDALRFLFEQNCRLVILACNTASSSALRRIQQEYLPVHYPERKVLGVLIPGAEEAVRASAGKKIGVLATDSTVRSGAFPREIKKLDDTKEVYQVACPKLVPLIESGNHKAAEIEDALAEYLTPLLAKNIDTLILGCTHYGLVKNIIRKKIGPDIPIIAEEDVIPEKLRTYLQRHPEIENDLEKNGMIEFYTTGEPKIFEDIGGQFFGPISGTKPAF